LEEGDDKRDEEGDTGYRVHVGAQAALFYVSTQETRCFGDVEVGD